MQKTAALVKLEIEPTPTLTPQAPTIPLSALLFNTIKCKRQTEKKLL